MDSSTMTFKNRSTSKTEKIENGEIDKLQWLKRAKGHCLNVITKKGNTFKFDGFQESDYQKLDDFSSKYLKRSVEKKDMSIKGYKLKYLL